MPVEFVFEMYGEKSLLLPFFTGSVARGLLLHMLKSVDPTSSEVLHQPHIRKAYAVSPLYFRSKMRSEKGYLLDPSYPCRFRVGFLEDAYAKLLLKRFESESSVLIYDTTFRIASMKVRSRSYGELLAESKPVESFRLVFQTPTCFAALGRRYHSLFPEPKHVFGGLLSLWNLYSDKDKVEGEEKEAYLQWLGREVGVSGFSLETQQVSTGKGTVIGFMGWTAYRTQEDEKWQRLTNCLAKLAEYSNIGKNRTAGFGVTRFISPNRVDAGE